MRTIFREVVWNAFQITGDACSWSSKRRTGIWWVVKITGGCWSKSNIVLNRFPDISCAVIAQFMTLNFCNSCFAVPGSSQVADHPVNVRGTIASIVRMRIKTKESVSCLIIGTVVDGLDVESSGVAVTFSCLPGITDFSKSFLDNLFTFSIRANHITD